MREREGHNQVVTGVDIRTGPIVIFLGMISHDNEENLSHVLFLRQIQGHVAGLAMACLSYLQGISERIDNYDINHIQYNYILYIS